MKYFQLFYIWLSYKGRLNARKVLLWRANPGYISLQHPQLVVLPHNDLSEDCPQLDCAQPGLRIGGELLQSGHILQKIRSYPSHPDITQVNSPQDQSFIAGLNFLENTFHLHLIISKIINYFIQI